jgi:prophage regulatory protein
MLQAPQSRHIVRPAEADRICGVSKSTRYRLEAAGKFPKRVILSERSSGYYSDEIEAWLESRPRAVPNGQDA